MTHCPGCVRVTTQRIVTPGGYRMESSPCPGLTLAEPALGDEAIIAISLEHQRDHDDGPGLSREGCVGCRMITEIHRLRAQLAERYREIAQAAWRGDTGRRKEEYPSTAPGVRGPGNRLLAAPAGF